jgi:hypothetical protein
MVEYNDLEFDGDVDYNIPENSLVSEIYANLRCVSAVLKLKESKER